MITHKYSIYIQSGIPYKYQFTALRHVLSKYWYTAS